MIEVELKARVLGSSLLGLAQIIMQRLFETRKYPLIGYTIFTYRDVYLTLEDQNMVRVRTTHDHTPPDFGNDVFKTYVTRKKKQVVDGIERNQEDETSVDQSFEETIGGFLSQGYKILYQKTKTGLKYVFAGDLTLQAESAWTPSNATSLSMEGSEILSLGQFYEIEKVLPDSATDEDVASANAEIRQMLADLGLSEEFIEPRSWKLLDAEVREQFASKQTNQ